MSGSDNVQINVRERPRSTDINDLQSMMARTIDDILGSVLSAELWANSSSPTQLPTANVLGGLALSPDANNVRVQAGAIAQNSAALTPTPGPLDSTYRVGFMRSNLTLTTPSPVTDTYYLIEAQVVDVVTETLSVDVLNNITGNFVPTSLPKKHERQIAFQFTTGTATNFPLPTSTGADQVWVPIGGVFRPAGGGAVLAKHLYDMRRLPVPSSTPLSRLGRLNERSYQFHNDSVPLGKRFSMIDVDGEYFGQRIWLHVNNLVDSLVLLEPQTVDPSNDPNGAAGGTWFYTYLCPWANNIVPVGQNLKFFNEISLTDEVLSGDFLRGVLVETTVAPVMQGGVTNGADVHLPAPFNAYVVPAGVGVLVGAFQRTGATGILAACADGPRVRLTMDNGHVAQRLILNNAAWADGTDIPVTIPANMVPVSARSMHVHWCQLPVAVTGVISLVVPKSVSTGNQLAIYRYINDGGLNVEFDYPMVSQDFAGAANTTIFVTQISAGGEITELTAMSLGFTEDVG